MKIALYIEDGLEQIILTPEGDVEKGILAKLSDSSRELSIKHGSFYECRGGWVRHRAENWTSGVYSPSERQNDESTMIVLRPQVDRSPEGQDGEAGLIVDESDGAEGMRPTPGSPL